MLTTGKGLGTATGLVVVPSDSAIAVGALREAVRRVHRTQEGGAVAASMGLRDQVEGMGDEADTMAAAMKGGGFQGWAMRDVLRAKQCMVTGKGGIETNEPSQQWTDNKAAHSVATKPGSLSDISRHLVKDITSLRGRVANHEPILGWCSTKEMIADLGTKFPRKPQYDYLKARVRGVERSSFFHNLRIPGADDTTTEPTPDTAPNGHTQSETTSHIHTS